MASKAKTIAEVLTLIKEKGYHLEFDIDVPDEFKGNTEIIASIMEQGRLEFDKLPESARNDKQLLMLIANKESSEFSNFPDWAKDDKDIVKSLSDFGWGVFENISERLRADREIVLLGLGGDSSNNLEYVTSEELKNDKEILKIAVSGHSQALHWVPEKWRSDKDLLDIILSKEVTATYSFEHFSLEYRDNEDIAKKVINDDAGCFQYLSERLRDNREIALSAVKNRGIYLEYASLRLRDDKEFVKIALKNDTWSTLRSVSDRLKNDIEIVLACVLIDNRTLQDFADEFKDNERVIEECMKKRKSDWSDKMFIQGAAYQYFSDRFKTNREIALHMSLGTDFNLGSAPENFRKDREIVKNAVKESANNFEHIGSELLKNCSYLKELYNLNDGILSYMNEDLKAQLFTTKVQSIEHFGKKIIYEMVIDDGYVQNNKRTIKKGLVKHGDIELVSCSSFPVLTYEDDGPVGSYLSVRYLNNILLAGNFTFFIKENTGKETWTNCLSHGSNWQGYGPEPQTNDDFLKHEVYLIPETQKNIEYNNLSEFPRIYFGRSKNIPNGIQLFKTDDNYREALTVLKQEKSYGEPKYKKINDNTLEAIPEDVEEIFGAARVYVEDFGWRFLIPHKEGALKALEVLKSTTDIDDLNWIKAQVGNLNEYQKNLLKEHFGNLDK
jgi:hypothetical protein